MSRFQNHVVVMSVVAAVVVIGGTVGARETSALPSPKPFPVQIVAPLPVPVTGAVSISGTPAVSVANDATQPVPTTNRIGPGFQPVSLHPAVDVPANSQNAYDTDFYTVPDGKRLVIDYIGARCGTPVGETVVAIQVIAMAPGALVATSEAIAPPNSPTVLLNVQQYQMAVVSQQVEMFANAGDRISVGLFTNAGPSGASVGDISINGYLVDAP